MTEEELLSLVQKLNEDEKVNGILVQLPLPAHIREDAVIQASRSGKRCGWVPPGKCGKYVHWKKWFSSLHSGRIIELLKTFRN